MVTITPCYVSKELLPLKKQRQAVVTKAIIVTSKETDIELTRPP